MKITIRVKPNARKNEVRQIDPANYIISVTAPPVDGKANEKVIEVLAEYLGKPKRCITLVRGETGKTKVIEIT